MSLKKPVTDDMHPGEKKLYDAYESIVEYAYGTEYYKNEEIRDTPRRAVEALIEFTKGYSMIEKNQYKLFKSDSKDLVIVRDIVYHSTCCHHLVPFYGMAHIAYIPDGHILGLSKFARIVDMFASRLQVQERMTSEIATSIWQNLKPAGVAVYAVGKHLCMCSRGVKSPVSVTQTQALRGIYTTDSTLRGEHMAMLQMRNEIL